MDWAEFQRWQKLRENIEERPKLRDRVLEQEDLAEGAECAICLEDLQVGDRGVVLSCGHCFHTKCINSWAKRKAECPTCRRRLSTCNTSNFAKRKNENRDAHAREVERMKKEMADLLKLEERDARKKNEVDRKTPRSKDVEAKGKDSNLWKDKIPSSTQNKMNGADSDSKSSKEVEDFSKKYESITSAEVKRRLTRLGITMNGICERHLLLELLKEAISGPKALSSLKVRELKRRMKIMKVSFVNVLEKSLLVKLLNEAVQKEVSSWEPVDRSKWEKKEKRSVCSDCDRRLGVFRPFRNCHFCGRLVCKKCSKKTLTDFPSVKDMLAPKDSSGLVQIALCSSCSLKLRSKYGPKRKQPKGCRSM
mmetsp:Transcript_8008/g.12106  ORF Transcript_8008/g.12106 Transcript_8008/m.12106 type:complete len:364 (-) Transcript_8008:118-1209(-)